MRKAQHLLSQLSPGCLPAGGWGGWRWAGTPSSGGWAGVGSGPTTAASLFRSRGLFLVVSGIPGNLKFGGDLFAGGDLPCRCCWVTEAGTGGSSSKSKGSELDPSCSLDTSEASMVESRLFLKEAMRLTPPGDDRRSQEERAGRGDPPAGPPSRWLGTSPCNPECWLRAASAGVLCFRAHLRDDRLVTKERFSSSGELNPEACQNNTQRSESQKVGHSRGSLGLGTKPLGNLPEV